MKNLLKIILLAFGIFAGPMAVAQSFTATPGEDLHITIVASDQQLFLEKNGQILAKYPVSTSAFGLGSTAGSNKTPLGKHEVASKFGDDAERGTIFKSRINTGRTAKIYTDKTDLEEDDVTTRILRLRGMEPGKNQGKGVDSFARYIYIHGTPEEGLIGQPASHGCIRMKNDDVIELYKKVEVGTPVFIKP